MTATQCKGFIDEEILHGKHANGQDLFTGDDKLVRVIIKHKRKPVDTWYNTISIKMDDADIVQVKFLIYIREQYNMF